MSVGEICGPCGSCGGGHSGPGQDCHPGRGTGLYMDALVRWVTILRRTQTRNCGGRCRLGPDRRDGAPPGGAPEGGPNRGGPAAPV